MGKGRQSGTHVLRRLIFIFFNKNMKIGKSRRSGPHVFNFLNFKKYENCEKLPVHMRLRIILKKFKKSVAIVKILCYNVLVAI